jgi:hypothetical protein
MWRALVSDGFAEKLEAVAHRAVEDGVVDLYVEAAEHRGVNDDLDVDVLAGGPTECFGQAVLLIFVESDRRANLGYGLASSGRGLVPDGVGDLG